MVKCVCFYYRESFVIIFLVVITVIYVVFVTTEIKKKPNIVGPIGCYRIKGASLSDISDVNPQKGKSIFFHETSCKSYVNDKITISSRQACAVESAARANPNLDVYLLYTSPGIIRFENTSSDRFLQALLAYKNVNIHHVNYERYTKDTPVEELYSSGKLDSSLFSLSHASDVLRYLSLWKYGGTYLDLDIIVVKSLENLPFNFAGVELEGEVGAGILNFADSDQGHHFTQLCVDDLKKNFQGSIWAHNGPGVITRLLNNLCKSQITINTLPRNCSGFTVYPPEVFYPVPYWKWPIYFDAKYKEDLLNLTQNSYTLHLWNKLSENTTIHVKSDVPYIALARKYCPKVFNECEAYF